MTRKKPSPLETLTDKVRNLDEQAVDELYGLEPVYRPDEMADNDMGDNMEPTIFATIQCPYCAESFETKIDLTAGAFVYVEDCQVCCQPIELHVEVDDAGRLRAVIPQRLD
jgi:hypothetical protein